MNISEIAKLAGVSSAAVSRYLNQGYLSEEKAEKISKVIEQTGYVPSAQAQTLRTRKTKLIGVIVPKISSEAVSRMVDGITGIAEESGYQILLANTDNSLERELQYLGVFQSKQVDGVIFIATIFTEEHKRMLSEMRVPVVLLGQYLDGYDCVCHDDYAGAKDIVRCFLKQGKQKIAFIGVDKRDIAAGQNRQWGYEDALKEGGLPVDPALITTGAFDMENGRLHAAELVLKNPGLDGIVCATDSIAVGAMTYLQEQGIAIPNRIAVAGVGDTRMSRVVTPRLTTVHLHYKTGGREAAKRLIEKMQGGSAEVRQLKLGFELICRQST